MRVTIAFLCAALFSAGAMAAGYNEKKSGDLSNDGLAPTVVKLKLGQNTIAGKFGKTGSVIDRDYFTIKIANGQQLASIILEPETKVGVNKSFIGVQSGKKVTVDPDNPTPDELLGWAHFTTAMEGTDILPTICEGEGAIGCTPPLGPGSYSFWVQETATGNFQYQFTFVVTTPAQ